MKDSNSTDKNQKGYLIEYKHPIFSHNEDGDIEQVIRPVPNPMFYFFEEFVDTYKGHILEKPLTDDIINTHFIEVINRLGPNDSLGHLLENHFNRYYRLLMADESEQPFFTYIKNILTSRNSEIRKICHDYVLNWIHSHEKYAFTAHNSNAHSSNQPLGIPRFSDGFPHQMWEIALWYTYQGVTFSKTQKDRLIDLALELEFKSPSSWSTLGDRFEDVADAAKRTDTNSEGRQIKDRIRKINSVIKFLPKEYTYLAEADIITLERKL